MKVIVIYYVSHQFSLAASQSGLWEVAKGRPWGRFSGWFHRAGLFLPHGIILYKSVGAVTCSAVPLNQKKNHTETSGMSPSHWRLAPYEPPFLATFFFFPPSFTSWAASSSASVTLCQVCRCLPLWSARRRASAAIVLRWRETNTMRDEVKCSKCLVSLDVDMQTFF